MAPPPHPVPAPPPFPLLSMASLAAGWYLAWRTLPHTIVVMVAALAVASLAAPRTTLLGLPLSQALMIVFMFPVYRLVLDRLVGDFALERWARRPERSVWWPITWRNFEANGLAVVLGHAVDETTDRWLANQTPWLAFGVALGLAVATAVIMIAVWGWITGRVLGRTPPFDDPIRLERSPGAV